MQIIKCIFVFIISFSILHQQVFAQTNIVQPGDLKVEQLTKEELYKQLLDTAKEDNITKEQLYQSVIEQQKLLIEAQKEKVTDLYQYINYAATILGIVVAIALGAIFEIGRRIKVEINRHQDKIDKILNSKEFDEKLKRIEESVFELKVFEAKQKMADFYQEYNSRFSNMGHVIGALSHNKDIFPLDLWDKFQEAVKLYTEEKNKVMNYKLLDIDSKIKDEKWNLEAELQLQVDKILIYEKKIEEIHDQIRVLPEFKPAYI